jgi:ribonucleoside-diphosphate reductase alpha chain
MAASVMDYIFRRLALDFLPFETRADLGIFTAKERVAQARAEAAGETWVPEVDMAALASSAPIETKPAAAAPEQAAPEPVAEKAAPPEPPASTNFGSSSMELLERVQSKESDAPLCFTCGTKMRPAGSCYVCEGCGSTSGCS